MKKIISGFIFVMLLFLILFPVICLEGAKNGLLLWFNDVLPSLFPFFVITRMIFKLDLCPFFLKPYYPVLTGILSGCPTGTYFLSDMVIKKQIPVKKAQAMLLICNNLSPAFLINYISCKCLQNNNNPYLILICVHLSSFIIYMFTNPGKTDYHFEKSNIKTSFISCLEKSITDSAEILVLIGGYIILFSIISSLIINTLPSGIYKTILGSIPELTIGAKIISSSDFFLGDKTKSTALMAVLCGFGGFATISQTVAPIRKSGMSAGKYIFQRILCALLSGILCSLFIQKIF